MLSFWTSLRPGDVVNVEFSVGDTFVVERCRVVGVLPVGFLVERADGQRKEVKMEDVKQRVVLPWKPEDLRDNFIVLRRRNARKEDYVEDLRVRRDLLRRILLLLTRKGEWRPGHGREALHLFYDEVDLRADHEIEDVFPEDEVPATLNFRDLGEQDLVHELDLRISRSG